MAAEGVKFEPGVAVGQDVSIRYLRLAFHAICLCMGAGQPRPLEVAGKDLGGIHFAMDFLSQQNRRVAGDPSTNNEPGAILAKDKRVVVIGGGDTGSDCVGTSIRQCAASVHQLEILPQPPAGSNPKTPWPHWPKIMRTSSSHEEGCQRRWSVLTKEFSGSDGHVTQLSGCEIDWVQGPAGWEMKERPGTDFTLPADLVLLAMGFLHVTHPGAVQDLEVALDGQGNVQARNWMSSVEGVFTAGDARRGASLVVHAIHEGRLAASAIDRWLKTTAGAVEDHRRQHSTDSA
jgi:glutamate synthase (NADPH/NADH) small chain